LLQGFSNTRGKSQRIMETLRRIGKEPVLCQGPSLRAVITVSLRFGIS
jgi:hypothetical protein